MTTKLLVTILLLFASVFAADLAWNEIKPTKGASPLERPLHACEVVDNKFYVYGGRTGLSAWANSFHTFDFVENTWSKPSVIMDQQGTEKELPTLAGHTMNRIGKRLYMFAGRSGLFSYSNEMYVLELETDVLKKLTITGDKPIARQGHIAVVLPDQKSLVVFGGTDGSKALNDLWIFDTEKNEWRQQEAQGEVQASEGHKAVLMGDNIYIFGGFHSGDKYITDIRVLNIQTWKWSKLTNARAEEVGMKPRAYHTASLVNKRVYLIGGLVNSDVLGDVRTLDLSSNLWIEKQPEGDFASRQGHCAVVYNSNVYVFGGSKNWKVRYNDIMALGTQTTKPVVVTPAQPAASQKDLSEQIEEQLMQVQLLIQNDDSYNKTSLAVEQELTDLVKKDLEDDKFQDLPERISTWNAIDKLYRQLLQSKGDVRNLTLKITFDFNEISSVSKESDAVRALLGRESSGLTTKLEELKTKEDSAALEKIRSQEAKKAQEDAASHVKDLESQLAQNNMAVVTKEKNIQALDDSRQSLHSHLDKLNAILSDDVVKEYHAKENSLLGDLERVRDQNAVLSAEIEQLNTQIQDTNKEISKYERKVQKLAELGKEAEEVKKSYAASKRTFEEFKKLKEHFIAALTLEQIAGENKPAAGSKDSTENANEEFLSQIDKLLELNKQELLSRKAKKTVLLEQLQDDLRLKRAKLKELKDEEAKLNSEIARVRERLDYKGKEREKSEKEKARVETEWKKVLQDYENENLSFEAMKDKKKTLEEDLVTARKDAQSKLEAFHLQTEREDEARNQLNKIKTELGDALSQLTRDVAAARSIQAKLDKMRRGITVSKSEYETERLDIVKAKKQLEETLQKADARFTQEIDRLKKENEELRRQIEALKGPSQVRPAAPANETAEQMIEKQNQADSIDLQKKATLTEQATAAQ